MLAVSKWRCTEDLAQTEPRRICRSVKAAAMTMKYSEAARPIYRRVA